MLAQFQARYPTGSLISELLQVYEGKFVVRVSAQVDGVTRSTGMAAAETIELAEDRARSRALAVLTTDQSSFLDTTTGLDDPAYSSFSQALPGEESTPATAVPPVFKNDSYGKDYSSGRPSASVQRFPLIPTPPAQEPDAAVENLGIMSDTQTGSSAEAPISFSNVTPLVPRSSYGTPESSETLGQTSFETEMVASEPIDLSDAIARTSVELKRLGWSNKQGREYLERTYNKRSRQQLSDEEMLEFLHHLESQPSPNQPFA